MPLSMTDNSLRTCSWLSENPNTTSARMAAPLFSTFTQLALPAGSAGLSNTFEMLDVVEGAGAFRAVHRRPGDRRTSGGRNILDQERFKLKNHK